MHFTFQILKSRKKMSKNINMYKILENPFLFTKGYIQFTV